MTENVETPDLVEIATELTIAWLSNPNTRASVDDAPAFLNAMYSAVSALGANIAAETEVEAEPEFIGAVTARKSLASKDHIISMIDGKPYKTLRRHLSGHGMTPDQYRERYNLKADYPMVSENYSSARREMAKKIGLGRKGGQTRSTASAGQAAPGQRQRKPTRDSKPASPE